MTPSLTLALVLALALALLAAAHLRLRATSAGLRAELNAARQALARAPVAAVARGVRSPTREITPGRPPAPTAASGGRSLEAPTASDGRPRLLVADDDPTGRGLTVAVLQRVGYQVDAVGDGLAAVAAARAVRYDLILLDIEMPGLDGPAAARQIRAEAGARPPKLLALTAHVGTEQQGRCRDAGVEEVLSKPIEIDNLRAVVARLLGPIAGPAVDLNVLRQLEDPPGDFILHLLRTYLHEAALDGESLHTAHAAGDRPQLARIAHRLKGSSAGVGARTLAARCQALHRAARDDLPVDDEVAAVLQALAAARAALLAAYPSAALPP